MIIVWFIKTLLINLRLSQIKKDTHYWINSSINNSLNRTIKELWEEEV